MSRKAIEERKLDLAFAKKSSKIRKGRGAAYEKKLQENNRFCSRIKEEPNIIHNFMSKSMYERWQKGIFRNDDCEGYCYSPILTGLQLGDSVQLPIFLEATPKLMTGTVIGFGRRYVRIDFGPFKESFTYIE